VQLEPDDLAVLVYLVELRRLHRELQPAQPPAAVLAHHGDDVPLVDGLDVEHVERERLPRLQPLLGPPQVPLVPDVAARVGRIGRRVDLDVGRGEGQHGVDVAAVEGVDRAAGDGDVALAHGERTVGATR